jgi:hypothetical protein
MKRLFLGVLIGLLMLLSYAGVYAAQSQSTNYEVNEVQFGAGGLLNASSANYRAQQSVGSTGVGTASSAHYGANAGFLTPNEPFLSMVVSAATINLGTLSTASTATGTATFSVRAYVDSGYVVLSMNNPPVNQNGRYLSTIPTAAASSVGNEQFGMNLVQNLTSCHSAPANFGANPVQIPSSAYANGQAANGYNTCGLFQYNQGDTIAESSGNGWGQTNYTISYIANISQITEDGSYSMTQDLVAVTTF